MPALATEVSKALLGLFAFLFITSSTIYTIGGEEMNPEEIAEQVRDKMEELLDESPWVYVEEDVLNEEALFHDAFIRIVDQDELTEEQFEQLQEEVYKHIDFVEIESEYREKVREQDLYRRDPYRYHGVSQKDFY